MIQPRGQSTYDGHTLKEIDLESWYSQLGALFQEYAHYNFKVKDAISIGRSQDKPNQNRVQAAAKDSEAEKFIGEWEKGYDQQLGKEFTDGVEPSIGQWQKLALARAFYRNPNIMILDEPTSSIDAEAEAKIFDTLDSLPESTTVLLISHRFSTVRKADQIAVIEDGGILELGSHAELLDLGGKYAQLFAMQAKGYK
jgi:ATP-binding cassette subfamily B protein